MRSRFIPLNGPTGPSRARRVAYRSFAFLCDRLVLIVLAVVALASAVPEEFQNTAALPLSCAWSSEDCDVDDETGNAERSPCDDTLFQHDQRFPAVLVRSKHFGARVTQDWDLAAHMRVGTRAPPARRGST